MKITKEGYAVVEGDMLLSKYVEEQGRLDVDFATTDLMRPYIPMGGTVIDVGACIGDHTKAYAEMVGETGTVIAFEPNGIAYECLEHNMLKHSNVLVFNVALGASDDYVNVIVDHHNIGATRMVGDTPFAEFGHAVRVTRLDGATLMLIARLDFIKIDAEGWEPLILDGAINTIKKFRPVMLIEVNRDQLAHMDFTEDDIYRRLRNLNYEFEISARHSYDVLALPVKERQ